MSWCKAFKLNWDLELERLPKLYNEAGMMPYNQDAPTSSDRS